MKYCTKCGKQLFDEAIFCPNCGCAAGALPQATQASNKRANGFVVFLCVLFPIIGLILWAVMHDDSPVAAKTYGKAALISFCVSIGLALFVYILSVIIVTAGVLTM